MKVEVKLEQLGDDKEAQATVSFWYFDPGEDVKAGDDLLEIVTDKATFNIAAPADGRLTAIAAREGDTVKVGAVLGEIETKE